MDKYDKNLITCEFCGLKFYESKVSEKIEEQNKYLHLITHPEFFEKVNTILLKFENLKKFIKIKKGISPLNKDQWRHNLLAILYNYEDYETLLNKLDIYLGLYGIELELNHPNIIKRKINDTFSFYSELKVYDTIKKSNLVCSTLDGSNNKDVDFFLKNDDLAIEVKTPLNQNKSLHQFVSNYQTQKQLDFRRKKFPNEINILCVNTTYVYPEFPIKNGDWFERGLLEKGDNLFWDCCITFNTRNKKSDAQINPNSKINKEQKLIIIKLKEELKS